jgi:16S rRNA (cytosine967-C5)-methyltransferase
MPCSPARTIAFDVLLRVATQGAYSDELLRSQLSREIRSDDAGLATELIMGTLRWQRLIDFLIDRQIAAASKSLDIEVRIALRMGVYQLRFLQRVPKHAAVYESVELVKRARKRSAATLVNAVLRKIPSQEPITEDSLRSSVASEEDRLGILFSHPSWMITRWLAQFGQQRTRAMLAANNRTPASSGYLRDPARQNQVLENLAQAGIRVEPGNLLRDAWNLHGANPAATSAVRSADFVLQDEASQCIPHLLGVEPGNTVLDVCAAPGGKTLLLARAAGSHGRVTAVDLHIARVRAMRERMQTAGAGNVECMELDASAPLAFAQRFDRVLIDAPCSGTGTLARHPEIRWKLGAHDLKDLHGRQIRLLTNALETLQPGGRAVYSTCSLEVEENEDVVNQVLSGHARRFEIVKDDGRLCPILQPAIAAASLFDANGFFRIFPGEHGTDGFFAAVIAHRNSTA